MTLVASEVDELVSLERGEIQRRIFSDPEIFELEMEQIFGRAWLFLCHESQLKKPGDFFESAMGRDNVLVVRQKDHSVKAFLNTCTHRGNAVCRAEEGNVRNFMCTYHGWTFDIDGTLKGVPGYDTLYHGELDKDALGLREIGQLSIYKGFVFGTHDVTAPSLDEYLGTIGRMSLDLIAVRGDMEVTPGIRKFVLPCNWKFAVDNLFDWYHPEITHMSALIEGVMPRPRERDLPRGLLDAEGAARPDGEKLEVVTASIARPAIQILGNYGHAVAGPEFDEVYNRQQGGMPQEWRDSPEAQDVLGPVGIRVGGHPNIFPTCWVTTSPEISLRIPRSVTETEVWWFSFVDSSAPEEDRIKVTMQQNHVFGPSGLLEQEDGENWAQSTMQTFGTASRRVPQAIKMNLGHGQVIKEHDLARIEGNTSEHAQLWTYHAWAKWLSGADWDELRAETEPPDVI